MKFLNRCPGSLLVQIALACCWTAIAATGLMAGEYNDILSIGDKAPEWTLPGGDGKDHTLREFADSKLVVMVFTCNDCPVARKYESRLIEFAKDYKPADVSVVAIHVHRGETLEQATEHAKKAGFDFHYLHDESQKVAKSYGARTTPHVFVLDGDRNIAYMGALDDNMTENKVEEHYLRQAVESLLAGEAPTTPETRQFGCAVKWK